MAKTLKEINKVIPFPIRKPTQSTQLRCTCVVPSSVHYSNVGLVCNTCLLPAKEGC